MTHPDHDIRGGVLIKFTDGESMRFNFATYRAAMDFYHRAQRRADAFAVTFLDPDLQSIPESGYPEPHAPNRTQLELNFTEGQNS